MIEDFILKVLKEKQEEKGKSHSQTYYYEISKQERKSKNF